MVWFPLFAVMWLILLVSPFTIWENTSFYRGKRELKELSSFDNWKGRTISYYWKIYMYIFGTSGILMFFWTTLLFFLHKFVFLKDNLKCINLVYAFSFTHWFAISSRITFKSTQVFKRSLNQNISKPIFVATEAWNFICDSFLMKQPLQTPQFINACSHQICQHKNKNIVIGQTQIDTDCTWKYGWRFF